MAQNNMRETCNRLGERAGRLGEKARFTQPRANSFAKPCAATASVINIKPFLKKEYVPSPHCHSCLPLSCQYQGHRAPRVPAAATCRVPCHYSGLAYLNIDSLRICFPVFHTLQEKVSSGYRMDDQRHESLLTKVRWFQLGGFHQ